MSFHNRVAQVPEHGAHSDIYWVAVKELKLSYSNKETHPCSIYPRFGNFLLNCFTATQCRDIPGYQDTRGHKMINAKGISPFPVSNFSTQGYRWYREG